MVSEGCQVLKCSKLDVEYTSIKCYKFVGTSVVFGNILLLILLLDVINFKEFGYW